MPLHLDEFQQPQFQGYIENIPLQRDYILRQHLPIQQTDDIQFAYNVINGEYAKAASITGWNASAPLRDNKSFETAFNEVAKVQHGRLLNEKQLLSFNRPRTDAERDRVVDYVYATADELSAGVDDIEEYMRAQALYTGKVVYDDNENDIHIDIKFDIPDENKLNVTHKWDQPNAEPLTDIQKAVKQFRNKNSRRRPKVMHFTSETLAKLLQNEQIRTQIYGDTATQRLITEGDLNNLFTALGLPPFEVNDDVIVLEDKGEVQLLEDNRIVFLGDDLGYTMQGITVENNYRPGKFVTPKIYTDPPAQGIIVGEAVFPALQRPGAIVMMDV